MRQKSPVLSRKKKQIKKLLKRASPRDKPLWVHLSLWPRQIFRKVFISQTAEPFRATSCAIIGGCVMCEGSPGLKRTRGDAHTASQLLFARHRTGRLQLGRGPNAFGAKACPGGNTMADQARCHPGGVATAVWDTRLGSPVCNVCGVLCLAEFSRRHHQVANVASFRSWNSRMRLCGAHPRVSAGAGALWLLHGPRDPRHSHGLSLKLISKCLTRPPDLSSLVRAALGPPGSPPVSPWSHSSRTHPPTASTETTGPVTHRPLGRPS